MKSLEALLEWGGIKRKIACLILSGIALLASMIGLPGLPFDPAWAAIILCGIPIILEAVIGLVTAFDIKADVLVSLALIASVLIGEDFAAGEVAFIMQLGALLEDLTVAKARAGIEKLVRLTPRTARRITPDGEETIPAQQVQVGDLLRVLPGESIPVDGMILSGSTSIDQSVMTGESLPVDKTTGDTVSSGTINRFGAFEMKALRVGEDSAIQRMIRLVQSADAGKAKIVGMADRWATWIVITALTAAALTWLATGEIIRAVTILVVFCPCALVLATPTAIMAAIGNATRHGFLVREGDALERLAGVSHVAFDKTGTLTCGTLQVSHIISFLPHCSQERLFALAAAVELRSEHPLGKAVVASYRQRTSQELSQPQQFQMIPGQGVSAAVEGHQVAAGNEALLTALDVPLSPQACQTAEQWRKEGCTIIYLALDGELAGALALSDTLRPNAAETIAQIHAAGVVPVLLTGDHEEAAVTIGTQVGLAEIHANCLPEDKLLEIQRLQSTGQMVCMIGDGINDAPALKKAHVGIAMGGVGSDIAVDAADIALVSDDIRQLPHLLRLSHRMMGTIRLNLTFSMALNFAAILLAMTGWLNPVVGALVHNAGSVLVILNSAFLLRWQRKTLC
ncbi:heavy metal translocating P-type ATPase [Angelakisella massiliensis]|uniref:heavy metal translocating P-type ATPase n=1 Tax=Angelakisella massiliensis TaxID=1871018 RepID=UPI0008F90F7E|nr:cation-translocating P-type ATPase [Angelakisella massiliensis]